MRNLEERWNVSSTESKRFKLHAMRFIAGEFPPPNKIENLSSVLGLKMPLTTLAPKIKNLEKFLTHCHYRRYPAKSTVICPGDRCETLYLIIKGSMSVLIDDDTGRELIITYLKSGEFFGEMGLFDREGPKQTRSAWVIAKTECEVAEVSYERFRELAKQDPELLYAVIKQMAERLRNTTRKAFDLTFLDITHRVARTLFDLCTQPGAMTHPDGIQVKITRQEIARIISCSREMVGRVLKNLENQGLVQVKGKTMVVFNPPADSQSLYALEQKEVLEESRLLSAQSSHINESIGNTKPAQFFRTPAQQIA